MKIVLDEEVGLLILNQFNNMIEDKSKVQKSVCDVHDADCLSVFGGCCHLSSLSATSETIRTLHKEEKKMLQDQVEKKIISKSQLQRYLKSGETVYILFLKKN